MEEDVEIQMLLKSNEEMLMEAVKLTDIVTNKVVNQSQKCTSKVITNFDPLHSAKDSLQKKEIVSGKMIPEQEQTLVHKNSKGQEIISPGLDCESEVDMFASQLSNGCANENTMEKPNNFMDSAAAYEKEPHQEMNSNDIVNDQLNQQILNEMANNPMKHYLSQHSAHYGGGSTSSEISCDEDIDCNILLDKLMQGEVPKPGSQQRLQGTINKNKQKLNNKAIDELVALQKLVLKRDHLLTEFDSKLQLEFLENQKKQKEIRDSISSLSLAERNKARETNHARCFFKKFGMPYFADSKGFGPPPNKDHKRKLERGELIVTNIPKTHYWIKEHKDMLQNAIKKSLIEEKSGKLVKEITKLKCKLEEVENNRIKTTLRKQITDRQNELRSLKSKSLKELISDENSDKEYDWMKFSVTMFNGIHSPDECKRFWHVYLKPTNSKDAWDDYEDSKLIEIAAQMNHEDWDAIAKKLGTNRTPFQCFVHYKTRLEGNNNFSTGKWTKEEDKKLLTVINASKIGDFIPWTKVTSFMGNRTNNQIYNRWVNCLNPKLVKGRFSKEEDLLIVSGIEVFGVSYNELASLMNNRSCSQIRERYERHLLLKKANVGTWSLEEDERLLDLVQKHGQQNWSAIANEMQTRSRTQVRQRYSFIQQMTKSKPGWTIEQVKRRNTNNVSKNLKITQKHVENLKKGIQKVEEVFSLSEREKEIFRMEKLKEIRDKVLFKKFAIRGRKKRVLSENSLLSDILLEFFQCYNTKSLVINTKFCHAGTDTQLNQILQLANFFGHELKLPENEVEIWDNPRLNYSSKCFLKDAVSKPAKSPSNEQPSSNTDLSLGENIDLVISDMNDETIIMKDWWHTPPVDVSRLNFGEFFKRTVFDYSYGMHKDIWDSKIKRSMVTNYSTMSNDYQAHSVPSRPFDFPPNQLTALGKRSLVLSRNILKRQINETEFFKELTGNLKTEVEDDDFNIKIDSDSVRNGLDKFQDIMLTLFTWPKVLSVTSIRTTPVPLIQSSHRSNLLSKIKQSKKIEFESDDNSEDKVENELEEMELSALSNEISQREQKQQSVLAPKKPLKRQLTQVNKSVACSRKMRIEHLVKKRKIGHENKSSKSVSKRVLRTKKNSKSKGKSTKFLTNNGNLGSGSSSEISQTLESTKYTYQNRRNTRSTNGLHEQQEKKFKYWIENETKYVEHAMEIDDSALETSPQMINQAS